MESEIGLQSQNPVHQAGNVEISTLDFGDDADVQRLYDLELAVHLADRPDRPNPCPVAFSGGMRIPPVGARTERRAVRDGEAIIGTVEVWLPIMDNKHFAGIDLSVHPEHRRRGIGRMLLDEAVAIARANGRRTVTGLALASRDDGPPRSDAGVRFAEAMGYSHAYTEVIRKAPVTAEGPPAERELYDAAVAASPDYETVAWTGRVPDEFLDGVAALDSSFLGEAPIGDLDLERENIDADRSRRNDERDIARGIFMCGAVARHRETGELVANTKIGVPTNHGGHAGQWGTLVSPQHRGHRLGMRLKVENLRQLRAHMPDIQQIWTGNADVNKHMIAINERLGFVPVDLELEYQLAL